jgi:acetolactate synthase-1/3 small subunit
MADIAKHTIAALVQDRPGVLNRVTSMIRRRNFNITSLAVGHSEVPGLSRMTFVVEGDDLTLEQVRKQLEKLIDVVKIYHLDGDDVVTREYALIRVRSTTETRSEILQIVDIFRANIVDVAPDSMVIEVTGNEDKLDSLVRLLEDFGVLEIMRTGRLAMARGSSDAANGEFPAPARSAERRRGRSKDELGW